MKKLKEVEVLFENEFKFSNGTLLSGKILSDGPNKTKRVLIKEKEFDELNSVGYLMRQTKGNNFVSMRHLKFHEIKEKCYKID